MNVVLIVKSPDTGELNRIDNREWSSDMIAALQHVNYLSLDDQEYQTIEGKLNVNTGELELLVTKMAND